MRDVGTRADDGEDPSGACSGGAPAGDRGRVARGHPSESEFRQPLSPVLDDALWMPRRRISSVIGGDTAWTVFTRANEAAELRPAAKLTNVGQARQATPASIDRRRRPSEDCEDRSFRQQSGHPDRRVRRACSGREASAWLASSPFLLRHRSERLAPDAFGQHPRRQTTDQRQRRGAAANRAPLDNVRFGG
jgi:hypothetical protein